MPSPSGQARSSASYVFWALFLLLIAAAVGVAWSWSNQRGLNTSRNDLFEALTNLRTLRENVQSAAHRRIMSTLLDADAGITVLESTDDELALIEKSAADDPVLQNLLANVRTELQRLAQATPDENPAQPLDDESARLAARVAETHFQQTLAAINAARERLLARFQTVSREAYDSALLFQMCMLAVLAVAFIGMILGAFLVRVENRRRDRVEQKLRDSEFRLERAEEIAHIGYWMNERQTDTVSGSPEYFRIYGLPYSESISSKTIFDRIHPDDVPGILRIHEEILTNPAPRTLEYRITIHGRVRHLIARTISETTASGTLLRSFGTVQDVTEQRAAQADARAWRTRFEAAIRAARQMVYERSPETNAIVWQGAVHETLGINPADISTLPAWKARIHPDDLGAFEAEMHHSSTTKTPFALEYRIQCHNGQYRHFLDRSHVIPSHDQSVVVGLIIDLSDRKRLEDELLQAQKLESIGRLAGGVAHDLNNWLTAILGFADLAKCDPNSENTPQYLDHIERAGTNAAKMTSQLLAFARRKVIELRVCSLAEVASDAKALLGPLLGENIRLHISSSPDLWYVNVDPVQFEQVIVNLAINARDAMPDGGRLTIETQNVTLSEDYARTHPEVTPGQHVMLAISDTGVGIPPDQLQRIFEPFYTTKPRGTGTGLGLATVLGLVKQHGGHIWVYSEVNKGTTFKIYIPRYKGARDVSASLPQRPSVLNGAETLLVVEDEELVRQLAVAALKEHGYNVIEAPSAEAALEYIERDPRQIHLVVTDVIMPGMSGKQIAAAVTKVRPQTRVLYTSGYTDNVVVHHGILDDGIHFLQKPYTPVILAAKVREVLDTSAAS
jgi:two-component system cell cycle sensor histidine kinase/response regulator CckA